MDSEWDALHVEVEAVQTCDRNWGRNQRPHSRLLKLCIYNFKTRRLRNLACERCTQLGVISLQPRLGVWPHRTHARAVATGHTAHATH